MEVTNTNRVQGVCATIDIRSTEVDFYVNGSLLYHGLELNPGTSSGGWFSGIDVLGGPFESETATLTGFWLTDFAK